jgi:hypothetical protein
MLDVSLLAEKLVASKKLYIMESVSYYAVGPQLFGGMLS